MNGDVTTDGPARSEQIPNDMPPSMQRRILSGVRFTRLLVPILGVAAAALAAATVQRSDSSIRFLLGPGPLPIDRRVDAWNRYVEHDVEPILQAATERNVAALERADYRLNAMFAQYRQGIAALATDLQSYSSLFEVTRRKISGLVADDQETRQRLRTWFEEKLTRHLFTEQSLAAEVADIVRDFDEELEASEAQLELDSARLPPPQRSTHSVSHLGIEARPIAANTATNDKIVDAVLSPKTFAARFVPDIVGLVMTATASGVVHAAAASGTVMGTASGATAGSAVPVAGTIVGAFVGLVAGLAADLYLSGRAHDGIMRDIEGLVNDVENRLVGSAGSDSPGLRETLRARTIALNTAQRSALRTFPND